MLGWEFPPVFSGGLGVVTQNLVKYLREKDQDITLLLPHFIAQQLVNNPNSEAYVKEVLKVLTKEQINILSEKIIAISTTIKSPYTSESHYFEGYNQFISYQQNKRKQRRIVGGAKGDMVDGGGGGVPYGENLFAEIARFVDEVLIHTEDRYFDVCHAHDWITAEAALQLKLQRGIPMIFHVHATEVDRTGHFNVHDSEIFRREQYAMQIADRVIAVSHYTKNILVDIYGIPAHKIEVVHNAYNKTKRAVKDLEKHWQKDKNQFWVLFIGRVTLQKGPDYFLETAKKVIPVNKNIHFLVAGDGDMMPGLIEEVAKHKLHSNVHFLGFLNSEQRDGLYRFTDACLVPSVSEPFGLTAIEVVEHRTPLIVSRNCGANEVIPHKLAVDFWDSEQMAEYVLALQKYPALRRTLRNKAKEGLPDLSWSHQVDRLIDIYNQF